MTKSFDYKQNIRQKNIVYLHKIMKLMSLGLTVNKHKNGVLIAYIAQSILDINLRKLLKLIYLIDEKFMEQRGFPLTWFDYYAWERGPVAPEVYEIKNGAFSGYVKCFKNDEGKNIVESILPNKNQVMSQMDSFSQYEMEIIDDIIIRYGKKTADELSDITHKNDSLWSAIVKEENISFIDGKSDVQIPLIRLNTGNVEKEEVYKEALEYMQFCDKI